MVGYADLVDDQSAGRSESQPDLEQISGGGSRRAVALTKQLLAFSRKQVLAITQVDVTR